jgi:predicted transcriptional regulator
MPYLTAMSRVLSTRLDDDVIDELNRATKQLHMTKKQFLEEAIRLRAQQDGRERWLAVLRESAGAWDRPGETPAETVAKLRKASEEESVRRAAYLNAVDPGKAP